MEPIQTLGRLLDGGEKRDAVHIAILPVVAHGRIQPGERIGLVPGTSSRVQRDPAGIGIADPFLECAAIERDQRFWMFLFPNTITGIRHDWTHPVVDAEMVTAVRAKLFGSKEWLRRFADRWQFDYDDMLAAAQEGDTHLVAGTTLHSASDLESDYDLFWYHVEMLTGKHFSPQHRETVTWSCSC